MRCRRWDRVGGNQVRLGSVQADDGWLCAGLLGRCEALNNLKRMLDGAMAQYWVGTRLGGMEER